jgi:YegS/Rv2252/BmrU family lipid kinase
MQRHIIYIVNEKAGTRTKRDLIAFIEQKTQEQGIPFDLVSSVAGGDYSFLDFLIREKRTTDIVVAGGDGTVSQAVNTLKKHKLNFGILPCGSGNGLALAAGIPRKISAALDLVFLGQASDVDAFTINGHFSCMLSGIGFDAQVAHDFARQSKRGLATYVKQVARNFISAKPFRFEIQLPGRVFTVEAFFVCIANGNQFGNNFTIAPKASLEDGMLDVVIARRQNKLALLTRTLWQVSGRNPVEKDFPKTINKGIIYFQAGELKILNPSLAPVHIDGDPAETAEEFIIRLEKKSFRLIRPVAGH